MNKQKALTGVSDDEQFKEMIVVLPRHVEGLALYSQVKSVS